MGRCGGSGAGLLTSVLLLLALSAFPGPSFGTKVFSLGSGTWELSDYGVRATIDRATGSVTLHQVTRTRCRLIETLSWTEFVATWGSPIDALAERNTYARCWTTHGISQYRWDRMAGEGLRCSGESSTSAATSLEVFSALDELFAEHYAFFALRGVNRDSLERALAPRAAQATSPESLFAVCREYLAPLADGHVSLEGAGLRYSAGWRPPSVPDPDGLVPRRNPLTTAFRAWLANPTRSHVTAIDSAAGGLVRWGVLDGKGGRVGYLFIQAMDGLAPDEAPGGATWRDQVAAMDDALDRALADFTGVRGVIVDLRLNGGGEDAVALALVSRFAPEPRVVLGKQVFWRGELGDAYDVVVEPSRHARFAGPVAVLAGPLTASAAEIAVLGFRAYPHVTVYGRPTMGLFSDALEKTLPNGWTITLSNEIYRAADGRVYEGGGVPPTVRTGAEAPRTQEERFGSEIQVARHSIGRSTARAATPGSRPR